MFVNLTVVVFMRIGGVKTLDIPIGRDYNSNNSIKQLNC